MNAYYPIGTIVKLTVDENRLFMISGYLTRQGEGKVYDYFAVPFPMGIMSKNQYISFNRKCITDVIHVGYCDEECQNILDGFDQLTENFKNAIIGEKIINKELMEAEK